MQIETLTKESGAALPAVKENCRKPFLASINSRYLLISRFISLTSYVCFLNTLCLVHISPISPNTYHHDLFFLLSVDHISILFIHNSTVTVSFKILDSFEGYLGMDSTGDIKRRATHCDQVYERRKKGTSSGKVPDSKKNKDLGSEPLMAKTDDKREIGDDGNYYVCEVCNDGGKLLCCEACPRTYHIACLGLKSIPKEEWKCANCFDDDDDLSKPIKYLKKLNFKKGISSKKVKDGSRSSL
ncbi:hypothetical protein VNO77_27765 [Canavalia gladiata]|uniref:PHD-type domain-containing protein n=1 Tax=Canavalia gladiata TaxID=3824 RepID=A0AAN9KWE1_CANGL